MAYGDALKSTDDLKGRDSVDLLARMLYSEAGYRFYCVER
ncbi:hypothetical protein EDD76_11668 [Kineothrix alysoides]|uniref:Uncharacterized protein n=1 Tax=Kineothrix alysoides TaxID=1469948 RepID=A0A4R1QNA2_9FIRM|nr:hypothetical protein EDD76_11668 [Kineothrix alysoides]